MITPNDAFVLVITGTLGIYTELIWPGRYVPGIAGVALVLIGTYDLACMELTLPGLLLIGAAAALFAIECFWWINSVAGAAATAALSAGWSLAVAHPAGISPRLAIPVCVLFGGLTIVLCRAAKRARRNKCPDLG